MNSDWSFARSVQQNGPIAASADAQMEPLRQEGVGKLSVLLARQRSQAARADVQLARLPGDHHGFVLDIRAEHAIGRPLRVAHVVPEHRAFPADFTLCHDSPRIVSSTASMIP